MPASKKQKKSKKPSKVTKNNVGRLVRQYVTTIEEKKFTNFTCWDSATPLATASLTTWTVVPLLQQWANPASGGSGITQGSSANQRLGNKCKLQGIDVMVQVSPSASLGSLSGFCRMCVVHDKRSNSQTAAPGGADIFTSNTNGWLAFPNPVFSERFTVTNEMVHSLVSTSTVTGGPEGLYKIHIPARTVLEFNGTNGTLANTVGSNYFFAFVSDQANCCNLLIQSIAYFTDA